MITVRRAGALTTVQDLGRPGWAHLGIPAAGAVDPPALALANRLVGNPPEAAGLEITVTGCALRFERAAVVAVTGAVPTRVRGGDFGVPFVVPARGLLEIGPAGTGVRTYLAVAGGLDVPPTLGSRATDTLSGLGPAPLRDGDVLPVGPASGEPAPVWFSVPAAVTRPVALRLWPGPRVDWFAAPEAIFAAEYAVSPRSNRVAARLTGPALERRTGGELASEGLVLGAVQVPAAGEPLVFLADHPTTGGYPVIGVVDPADLPALAQSRPGTPVRFLREGAWT
ncbi:allophanate hydrolase [Virgisporangium aliadipatigenens]|uniref:Allophanate hydrolase n=1 Tax=Virgisporangium aliadipatigenens TaxID=741659 RepID=A0A8J3YM81_9ACTN|nr:biotin-dependent carboxyltransferase family protein [Virgisporangium aliadipatigenens]GIJ46313.1 allophanate hydrolase [Virgisporangium aliadipatigenens]